MEVLNFHAFFCVSGVFGSFSAIAQTAFGKFNNLAGIQAAVAGQDEADDANQSKQINIRSAEHFNAQNDRSKRGIRRAAEQTDQPQRSGDTGLHADEASQQTAEGRADAEGGNDFAALKACSQRYGGEKELDQEGIPFASFPVIGIY